MIVIDTGPVVAAANRKDDYHLQCVDLLQNCSASTCSRTFPARFYCPPHC